MGRIDLNMSIPCFCSGYLRHTVNTRIENILYWNSGLKCIREVCEMQESDLFKFRNWGKKSQIALKDALSECDLHLGMSDKELDDYERYWLEEKTRDIHTDTIDWEQRRWELAVRIFMEAPYNPIEQTAIESLNKADIFIRQYRQILNTEE